MSVATNDPTEALLSAALARASGAWFDVATEVEPTLLAAGTTRASRWYRYDVHGTRVFVKAPQRSPSVPGTGRPRVLALPDFTTKHRLEHAWLQRVSVIPGAVRSFGLLDDPPALVMEDVSDPSLDRILSEASLRAAGRWLRSYHELDGDFGEPTGEALAEARSIQELAEDFERALGPRAAAIADRIAARADLILASTTTLLHGDFAPSNVFVGSGPVIRPIDPAPRRGPALFDLAYLVTALRASRRALLVPGGQRRTERLVRALLDGYGDIGRSKPAFEVLLALAVLDKWAAADARRHAASGVSRPVDRLLCRRVASLADGTLLR